MTYRVHNSTFAIGFQSDSGECLGDHLAIYDGTERSPILIGQFCGEIAPYGMKTEKNYLRVVFRSDNIDGGLRDHGFKMTVILVGNDTVGIPTACQGEEPLHVRTDATIASPGYPFSYGANLTCRWLVTSSTSASIKSVFFYIFV
jgi:hypothetical protein